MIWLSLLIPLILSTILFVLLKNRNKSYFRNASERNNFLFCMFIIPFGVSFLVMLIMYLIMINYNTSDIEYLTFYYTKIRHVDEWNEQKTRTVSYTVNVNGSTQTQVRVETYTEYHPEEFMGYLNNGESVWISSEKFNNIKDYWNVPMQFIDMHRKYHTIDGDAQEYKWDEQKKSIYPYVLEHRYRNQIIGSQSAFKFNNITKDKANAMGLYDYPKVDKHMYEFIIGYTKHIKEEDYKSIRDFNAIYGYDKQITCFLLLYPNISSSIVEDQRSYWQGGNKNEFIICVGIDSLNNKVQWSQCFSWMDDITMEVECRKFINNQDTLNIIEVSDWLENNIKLWERKCFEDFNYLNVVLTDKQEIDILFSVLSISIATLLIFLIPIIKKE